jgi:hypothetical protein
LIIHDDLPNDQRIEHHDYRLAQSMSHSNAINKNRAFEDARFLIYLLVAGTAAAGSST